MSESYTPHIYYLYSHSCNRELEIIWGTELSWDLQYHVAAHTYNWVYWCGARKHMLTCPECYERVWTLEFGGQIGIPRKEYQDLFAVVRPDRE